MNDLIINEITEKVKELFPDVKNIKEIFKKDFESYIFLFDSNNNQYFGRFSLSDQTKIRFQNDVLKLLENTEINTSEYLKFNENYNIELKSGNMFISKFIEIEAFQIETSKFNYYNDKLIELDISNLLYYFDYYKNNGLETLISKNPKLMYSDSLGNVFVNEDKTEIFFSNLDSFNLYSERYRFCPAFVLMCSSPVELTEDLLKNYCSDNNLEEMKFINLLITFCNLQKIKNPNPKFQKILKYLNNLKGIK